MSCHGLPHNATGVLAVGGLLASSPSAATRSADLLAPSPSAATRSADLLAPSPSAATRSADLLAPPPSSATESHTTARAAAVKPCSSPRTLSALGHSVSWRYCYGAGIKLGPWKSAYFGQAPTQRCPPEWVNTSQVQPPALRVILSNDFPAAVYVEPTTAWAWSYSFIFGTVTNWQFSGSITAMWSWNCYQVH